MIFGNIHLLDLIVVTAYLVLVIYLGYRKSRQIEAKQEDYFLAGRKLGKVYQFFLNFGNSADITGAVSTASLVYRQGVSGVWLGFQLIFLNPYYWFMNAWFRRVRLVTMADLFEDRLGSRGLATFYAGFQIVISIFIVIGFGNLVTYKISSALIVKSEATWTASERASVEGYRELQRLTAASPGPAGSANEQIKLAQLREREARGELKSYVTALNAFWFYVAYAVVVGFYVIIGGMAATAVNEVLQSTIIVAFSIMLIPTGLAAIGGGAQLRVRVPEEMFQLVGANGATQHVTAFSLFALFLVALVQINGILGNMAISGSARDEYAARFGAVAGTYGKRLMFILWAFTGLIAVALFHGADSLSDPDLVWGMLSRRLLGPGLLGLMLTGVIAANMSHIAAQAVAVSALFVRNIYHPLFPGASEAKSVSIGRWTIFCSLAAGVGATLMMDSVYSMLLLLQTAMVPMGATVMLMFFWRRLTAAGAWAGIVAATALTIIGPFTLNQLPALRAHATLTARVSDESGRLQPVYFDSVARVKPEDLTSPLEGSGRLNLELVMLRLGGIKVEQLATSSRFAARLFVDALTPFIFLVLVSLVTKPPGRAGVDLFFGKMKTPVDPVPERDEAAMEATRKDPHRFDHTKLFGAGSAWEFTHWNRVDTIGFCACCVVSTSIIALFWFLLRWASTG